MENVPIGKSSPKLVDLVEIGDYIEYDPTYLDAEKTQNVDANKLTYTSPKGTGQSHGNGYKDVTFTAKSDLNWRVLSISDDNIEIISENSLKDDKNSMFYIKGAIGYLYLEQELNEICKIYGYGYGANTRINSDYTIGGPLDTNLGTIQETEARCISIEDIDSLAKIGKIVDNEKVTKSFTDINSNYGNKIILNKNIKYPTTNTLTGISDSTNLKNNLMYTSYRYNKSLIDNTDICSVLFNENSANASYWLASRCVSTESANAYFHGRYLTGVETYQYSIDTAPLCTGKTTTMYEYSPSKCVRPIVTLHSNSVDISNANINSGKDVSNAWKLK